jgi:hypothetical protein
LSPPACRHDGNQQGNWTTFMTANFALGSTGYDALWQTGQSATGTGIELRSYEGLIAPHVQKKVAGNHRTRFFDCYWWVGRSPDVI